jgi:hypothetical protein
MTTMEPRAFLALMGLARKCDEDTLRNVRAYFPDLGDQDLVQLARDMKEERNRQILVVVTKIAPLRKVTCWSKESSILECGHVTKAKVGQRERASKCRTCLVGDNRNIVKLLRPSGV